MWKLNEVYAQNICAFRELSFKPQPEVTTLIFGCNCDNESQKSNGSGKSALIECVALGITGSTLRKVKNEEIINDQSEQAYIELVFKNDSLREVFVIERELFRKGSSQVKCRIERNGCAVAGEGVQPSVEAYNRFILAKLGISKDELLNSFILSKYRYQDFLSSSDREKKDIINRFSNGILVDDALARIKEDKVPLESKLKERELEVAECNGRLKVIQEQIKESTDLLGSKKRVYESQIKEKEEAIVSKKEVIRLHELRGIQLASEEDRIKDVERGVLLLENSGNPIEYCIPDLVELFSAVCDEDLSGWGEFLEKKDAESAGLTKDLGKLEKERSEAESVFIRLSGKCTFLKKEYTDFTEQYKEKLKSLEEKEGVLKKERKEAADGISTLRKRVKELSGSIELISNALAGTISCPECNHIFLVSDKNFNPRTARNQVREKQLELTRVNEFLEAAYQKNDEIDRGYDEIVREKQSLSSARNLLYGKLQDLEQKEAEAKNVVKGIERKQQAIRDTLSSIGEEVVSFRRKVFDEAFEVLEDLYKSHALKVKGLKEEIASAKGSLESMESTLADLRSHTPEDMIDKLKVSLKRYNKEYFIANDIKCAVLNELRVLSEQEQNFMGFKTYLANSKIEALSKVTNEFLVAIGSDIRIQFSGYTVLKTGKVRERISISLIRDGVDCGSFGKFSAGEAARVNLATILAMQKLINSNAEDGKGLDLLILDEILEAVDENGLACMFEALNQIGTTTLVVSHGNIAEGYPHTFKIVKENGESRIEG